jgi:hypothetical protein
MTAEEARNLVKKYHGDRPGILQKLADEEFKSIIDYIKHRIEKYGDTSTVVNVPNEILPMVEKRLVELGYTVVPSSKNGCKTNISVEWEM